MHFQILPFHMKKNSHTQTHVYKRIVLKYLGNKNFGLEDSK